MILLILLINFSLLLLLLLFFFVLSFFACQRRFFPSVNVVADYTGTRRTTISVLGQDET